jgi:hypothetical protein
VDITRFPTCNSRPAVENHRIIQKPECRSPGSNLTPLPSCYKSCIAMRAHASHQLLHRRNPRKPPRSSTEGTNHGAEAVRRPRPPLPLRRLRAGRAPPPRRRHGRGVHARHQGVRGDGAAGPGVGRRRLRERDQPRGVRAGARQRAERRGRGPLPRRHRDRRVIRDGPGARDGAERRGERPQHEVVAAAVHDAVVPAVPEPRRHARHPRAPDAWHAVPPHRQLEHSAGAARPSASPSCLRR